MNQAERINRDTESTARVHCSVKVFTGIRKLREFIFPESQKSRFESPTRRSEEVYFMKEVYERKEECWRIPRGNEVEKKIPTQMEVAKL